jgi:lysophospholipase L1-like esterase
MHFNGLFSALFFLSISLYGQNVDRDLLRKYPFLKLEDNRLEFKGDSAAFMRFYQKLDTLIFTGKGQVNIVHFGGSHVQAGTLSDRMRQNWLQLSPGLKHSRGFFFPYRLAHTNNPKNYSISYDGFWEGCRCAVPSAQCQWGVSGINASTVDTNAAFSITAYDGDTSAYEFTRVRLFYIFSDSSLVPEPDMPQEVINVSIDSVSNYVEYTFAEPCTTFTCAIQQRDSLQTGFTLQGIQYVSNEPGLTYHSIGVNGAATYSFLRCANFTNQLQSLQPDLVIFGLGINDAYRPENQFSQATYEANYDSLVWKIHEVNPDAVFIFMTNNDSYYKRRYSNPNIVKVQKAMESLSAKYQSACWDLFEIMGGFNSIRVWERYGLAKRDKIHFTPAGYALNADLLFEAIKRSYGNYLHDQYNKSN